MIFPRCLQIGLILVSTTLVPVHAVADDEAALQSGIVIHGVNSTLRNEVHYLNANIGYTFGRQVVEALEKGVALTIVVDIEIYRQRSYLWNERVTSLEQRYQLGYHALTRQFTVRNLNIGTLHNFPTFEAALSVLGTIVDLPLIDNNLLLPGQNYRGRLHARLDTNTLPVPLRLIALVSPDWRLASEWREWDF